MAEKSSGGIGVIGALGVLFVAMKLMGYIDWSWWLVTLPFWGGVAIVASFMLVYFIYLLVKETMKENK